MSSRAVLPVAKSSPSLMSAFGGQSPRSVLPAGSQAGIQKSQASSWSPVCFFPAVSQLSAMDGLSAKLATSGPGLGARSFPGKQVILVEAITPQLTFDVEAGGSTFGVLPLALGWYVFPPSVLSIGRIWRTGCSPGRKRDTNIVSSLNHCA